MTFPRASPAQRPQWHHQRRHQHPLHQRPRRSFCCTRLRSGARRRRPQVRAATEEGISATSAMRSTARSSRRSNDHLCGRWFGATANHPSATQYAANTDGNGLRWFTVVRNAVPGVRLRLFTSNLERQRDRSARGRGARSVRGVRNAGAAGNRSGDAQGGKGTDVFPLRHWPRRSQGGDEHEVKAVALRRRYDPAQAAGGNANPKAFFRPDKEN
jgi:hypothetical protein